MSEADGLRQRRPLRPQVVTDDGQAPEAKDGSSFSGRVFRVTFVMLAVSLTVPLLGAMLLLDSPIDPQPLSFKEPPLLLGVLQPNTKLQQAERLFENQLIGPESIANIGGEVKLLISSETPIEGRKMSFVNDLTITQDGRKIYFTDSSSKWQRRDYLLLVMEGTDDGRLLEYDTETKEVKVLLDQLRFPNGVQLSPAEDFVLVAETTMARIRRFYLSGLMKGGADLFVENLPGFPDNIRPSSSGGYWVGMATIRSNPGFSMLDFLSERPYIKRMIFKLFSQETVMKFVPRYSLVLELSDSGAFRRSLHDPDGQVASYISEVHEHDGHLYLGSFRAPFLCRLSLQSVQQP
ncbi:adipocyte plasma membrane-associated protein isoform X3 [Halichoerus grypus]|uniref:adipocyte plasma membrane-associated protein isoform X4 n=1 Tax=Halichoerus grypus TaxID=9711 RepID=UPI001659734F|nr:adipocyte plasma membrane-associated protein isoform X4 [Halichoerus grypus]